MKGVWSFGLAAVLLSWSETVTAASLELGAPFRDHAVLQRGMKLPVWGKAAPGDTVTVSFAGQVKSAVADAAGAWRVTLDPLTASKEPRDLVVETCADGVAGVRALPNQTILHDILVGEVWLCAGQSNMAIPFWDESPRGREKLGVQFGQICNRPDIRVAVLRNDWAVERQTKEGVSWQAMTSARLKSGFFSAVGAWFGIFVHDALDVPVGLLGAYVGATGIETWTPQGEDGERIVPADKWTKEMVRRRITGAQQQPGAYFNGKIAPIVPYALRGMVWYQGEHDAHGGPAEAAGYTARLHALYDGYAREFENPNLGFRFTQLAPWGSDESVYLQEAQAKFAAEEKRAAMCVIADRGNLKDIHPNDKLTVGLRLALLALKYDYGREDVAADSPVLRDWTVEDGKFVMTFDHVTKFCLLDPDWCYHVDDAKTDTLGFEVAGADGKWHPARIGNLRKLAGRGITWTEYRGQIDGGPTLTVWSDAVKEPKRLRYLHSRPWFARVINEAGLPLGPFHIDRE